MKVTDKINLFVEHKSYKKNGEEKVFHKLSTTIATKQKDGSFLRMSLDIIANDKKYPDAVLKKLDENKMYTANIINGWLMVDDYVNKDGKTIKKLVLYVDEMKLTGNTPIDTEKRKKALETAKGAKTEEDTELPL